MIIIVLCYSYFDCIAIINYLSLLIITNILITIVVLTFHYYHEIIVMTLYFFRLFPWSVTVASFVG